MNSWLLKRLSDEELLKQTHLARLLAHDAPRSDPGNPSDAWARRTNEWAQLANECDRRGLKQPEL